MNPEIPEPTLDLTVVLGIQKGVAEFNAGKFFECHDTLEEIWQGTHGPARDFFGDDTDLGRVLSSPERQSPGRSKPAGERAQGAQRYGDRYAGMELENLRSEVGVWLKEFAPARACEHRLPTYPNTTSRLRTRWARKM